MPSIDRCHRDDLDRTAGLLVHPGRCAVTAMVGHRAIDRSPKNVRLDGIHPGERLDEGFTRQLRSGGLQCGHQYLRAADTENIENGEAIAWILGVDGIAPFGDL